MKKRVLLATPVLALLALFVGCTSLLGTFEVASSGGGDGGGEGAACTQCGADCVDLATSSAHCGRCEVTCAGGQSCQASACACAADQAFCGNQCQKADRTHCGATCVACKAEEICSSGCVAAPLPELVPRPLPTLGWVGPDNKPLAFNVKPTGAPGTIYECRTAPDADFTPTNPAWGPCDGATGTGTTHTPKPDTTKPEGTYRTELRYRFDTYTSASVSYVYYTHHSLDRAPTCPRTGHAEDGPHFTDDQFFAAAQAYSALNQAKFPTVTTFPTPSDPPVRTDPIYLRAPFIKIPFTDIRVTIHMQQLNAFPNNPAWPPDHGNYVFNERTLRHTYVMNPGRTMILVKRLYAHPKTVSSPVEDCTNIIHTGSKYSATLGPADAARGKHTFDCDAFVVNTHGNGLCLGKNAAGTAPEPIAIDHDPRPAATTPNGTITNVDGTGLATTTATILPAAVGSYVEIPAGFGAWGKITAVTDANHFRIAPPPGAFAAGTAFLVSPKTTPVVDIPTGYVKLHEAPHGAAAGLKAPNTPSARTKCETPGCNAGKPWLIFLPP